MPLDSPLVGEARELARRAHQHQVRKASGAPYFTHLDAVAHILFDHGYDDDTTLAAAYLHDLAEDQPGFVEQMRSTVPAGVVEIVDVLSEQKLDTSGRKRPKADRFADYVRGLSQDSDVARRAIPISCADRIHNTLSIVQDEQDGRSPFMLLATRPGELREQLTSLRSIYSPAVSHSLLESFDSASRKLDEQIDRWLPGRAAMLAAQAHLGQFDQAGEAYILHPMRLAVRARTSEERVVALLHDVIEDTPLALSDLTREGFSQRVVEALDHLTRRQGEDYDEFIERIAKHRLATRVKLLDLADNTDLSRLSRVEKQDRERAQKYHRAIDRLNRELARRSLYLKLDETSRDEVRRRARLPIVRGDHITLAYRIDPDCFTPECVPGQFPVGSAVSFEVTHSVRTAELEVFVVAIAGQTLRPQDGGTLHVTVSRAQGARSRDSNQVIEQAEWQPMTLRLGGTIEWADD